MASRRKVLRLLSAAVLLFSAPSLLHSLAARSDQRVEDPYQYQSNLPLGIEKLVAQPSKRELLLIASAESPAFDEWHAMPDQPHRVFAPDGTPVRYFPERIDFRVTATARMHGVQGDATPMPLPDDLDSLMRGLSFRVRIFDGVNVTDVQPESVSVIGVPLDVPYDERIWRVGVRLPRGTRIDERIVFEVMSPDGERLAKFHLEF